MRKNVMRIFCNICLGNFIQNVSIMDDKGLVRIEKIPTPDLPMFFSELKEVDEITLKGPDTYIKKVQKDTEYQVDNTRPIKFVLQS